MPLDVKQNQPSPGEIGQKIAEEFAAKLATEFAQMAAKGGTLPVTAFQPKPPDRSMLTTKAEGEKYGKWVDAEFFKLDTKSGKPTEKKVRYMVVNFYPKFTSANPDEYIGMVAVNRIEKKLQPDGIEKYAVVGSFNMNAREFSQQYTPCVVEEPETE